MTYSHDQTIDQETGEFDHHYIMEQATLRAAAAYGSPEFPPSFLRSELLNLHDVARIMRKRWREDRGLPDDTNYVPVAAFGHHQDGVRRSAF